MARLLSQSYEEVHVEDVQLHPDNAKLGDVPAIAESIDRNGFYGSLVVQRSTGYILVGNYRWLAARQEGLDRIPVIWVDCNADEARRIMVADNRTSALGEFDMEKLTSLLEGFDGDLAGTGYSIDDLQDLLGGASSSSAGQTAPDAVPASAPALTVPGDLWLLGPHRLVCGSSTDPTALEQLLAGDQVDVVWTDPPYNVDVEGAAGSILNDDLSADDFADLLAGSMQSAFAALRPGGSIYVAHAETERLAFTRAFLDAGFKLAGLVVWRKHALTLSRSDYQWQHEPILYGWKPGGRHRWFGGRKQTTVVEAEGRPFRLQPDGSWHVVLGDRVLVLTGTDLQVTELEGSVMEYDRPSRAELHPTMKPVALVSRHLVNSSRTDDVVLDLFGGSGTTLIAAHQLGRRARLVELDPKYCDVICRRFQEHTGIMPVAAATGRAHSFVEEVTDGEARTSTAADEPPAAPRRNKAKPRQPERAEATARRPRRGA